MFKESFVYNGATVTIRRANVRSRLLETIVYRNFDIAEGMPLDEWLPIQSFVEFLTRSEIEGDLGFKIPAVTAPTEEIMASFDEFLSQDETFYDLYIDAKNKVQAVIGDPVTAPPEPGKKKS